MKCQHCGNENPDQATFCMDCGCELIDPVQEEVPQTPPVVVQDPGEKFARLSMIIGLASAAMSLLMCWVGPALALTIGGAATSCAFAFMSIKRSREAGFEDNQQAKIGILSSIVAAAMAVLYLVLLAVFFVFMMVVMLLPSFLDTFMFGFLR